MELIIAEIKGKIIARLDSKSQRIDTIDDAVDLIGNAGYLGASKVILEENRLSPKFFDLKTGFAGEVLQKFSNYNMQLAIVGDFDKFTSKALSDFIYESNKTGRIFFVENEAAAESKLTGFKI